MSEAFIPEKDAARTDGLGEAVLSLLPGLEAFNRFEGKDPAAVNKPVWIKTLKGPLPVKGEGLQAVLKELNQTLIPNGLRNGAPGFSGWITTAPTVSGVCAALASAVAGSQRVWEQPFNFLETLALDWLKELFGLPSAWQGIFVGGGSEANIIGLAAARQQAFENIGVDPAKDGLPRDIRWRLYSSEEAHHVVMRAAAVLGLGRSNVTLIPALRDCTIDLQELRRALKEDADAGIVPIALVANAGTVNTGAIDPIQEMADIAEEFKTWLHIDGAYGAFGRLDPDVAHRYEGLDRAYSLAADPHKWMAVPVGCGSAFVCDRALLGRAFTLEVAEYLEGSAWEGELKSPFDSFGDAYHHFGLAQSAPSRGVQVWAVLKEIGLEGMRQRVVFHNHLARRLAERVCQDSRLELVHEPVLSICCFRYKAPGMDEEGLNDLNERIAARLRRESRYVPSTTKVNGKTVIRPCFINPRTQPGDIEGLVESVLRFGNKWCRFS